MPHVGGLVGVGLPAQAGTGPEYPQRKEQAGKLLVLLLARTCWEWTGICLGFGLLLTPILLQGVWQVHLVEGLLGWTALLVMRFASSGSAGVVD